MELDEVDLTRLPIGRERRVRRRPVSKEILVVELVLPHQLQRKAGRAGLLHHGKADVFSKGSELRLKRRPSVGQSAVVAEDIPWRDGEDVGALLQVINPATRARGETQGDRKLGLKTQDTDEIREKHPGAAMASLAG